MSRFNHHNRYTKNINKWDTPGLDVYLDQHNTHSRYRLNGIMFEYIMCVKTLC